MKSLLAVIVAAFMTAGGLAQDMQLTADNIDKLLKAMTLEEKAAIIVGKGSGVFDGRGRSYDYVAGSAGATNAIDRLGIPPYPLIHQSGDNQRHDQLEQRLQQFESRTEDTFFQIGFHRTPDFLHRDLPSGS